MTDLEFMRRSLWVFLGVILGLSLWSFLRPQPKPGVTVDQGAYDLGSMSLLDVGEIEPETYAAAESEEPKETLGPDDPEYYAQAHQPPVEMEISRSQSDPENDRLIDFNTLRETRPDGISKPIFPEGLKARNGQTVEIIGFMAPYDSMERMNLFMLFPYPVGCYFCVPPSLTEVVFVKQAKIKDADYIEDAIMVRGTLKLWHPEIPEDQDEAGFLFTIDGAGVEVYQAPK